MTSMVGKLSLVIATAGGFSFMALSPTPIEAGVIHQNLALAAPTENSDVVLVRDRRRTHDRRYPCDHSYQTARDGSRCGNRAADRRRGGW